MGYLPDLTGKLCKGGETEYDHVHLDTIVWDPNNHKKYPYNTSDGKLGFVSNIQIKVGGGYEEITLTREPDRIYPALDYEKRFGDTDSEVYLYKSSAYKNATVIIKRSFNESTAAEQEKEMINYIKKYDEKLRDAEKLMGNVCMAASIIDTKEENITTIALKVGDNNLQYATDLSWSQAARIVYELIKIYIKLHAAKITYTDLKPENVVYRCTGIDEFKVWLIDYGGFCMLSPVHNTSKYTNSATLSPYITIEEDPHVKVDVLIDKIKNYNTTHDSNPPRITAAEMKKLMENKKYFILRDPLLQKYGANAVRDLEIKASEHIPRKVNVAASYTPCDTKTVAYMLGVMFLVLVKPKTYWNQVVYDTTHYDNHKSREEYLQNEIIKRVPEQYKNALWTLIFNKKNYNDLIDILYAVQDSLLGASLDDAYIKNVLTEDQHKHISNQKYKLQDVSFGTNLIFDNVDENIKYPTALVWEDPQKDANKKITFKSEGYIPGYIWDNNLETVKCNDYASKTMKYTNNSTHEEKYLIMHSTYGNGKRQRSVPYIRRIFPTSIRLTPARIIQIDGMWPIILKDGMDGKLVHLLPNNGVPNAYEHFARDVVLSVLQILIDLKNMNYGNTDIRAENITFKIKSATLVILYLNDTDNLLPIGEKGTTTLPERTTDKYPKTEIKCTEQTMVFQLLILYIYCLYGKNHKLREQITNDVSYHNEHRNKYINTLFKMLANEKTYAANVAETRLLFMQNTQAYTFKHLKKVMTEIKPIP